MSPWPKSPLLTITVQVKDQVVTGSAIAENEADVQKLFDLMHQLVKRSLIPVGSNGHATH